MENLKSCKGLCHRLFIEKTRKIQNVSKHAIVPFPLIAININHKCVQSNFDLVMCSLVLILRPTKSVSFTLFYYFFVTY